MARSPIISREVFFDRNNDGTMRFLDFALVHVEGLGAMIELRSAVTGLSSNIANIDGVDAGIDKISEMDDDAAFRLLGQGINQFPFTRNV